jgi:EAL domain-containing protein (putative c-di-GMP-specific phosphodiesterase class I)
VNRARERRRNVGDAIFADEIGIEYAILGNYRLRSVYQPIFSPRDGMLVPVAVEALVQPHLAGKAVSPTAFFETLPQRDRLYAETMCRVLHLRNFRNLGVSDIDLFFNYNPQINVHAGRALAEIRLMAMHLGAIDLDPSQLVCEITEQAAPDDAALASLVREMRRNGIRIAVDDFGAGHSTAERLALIEPDIVKLDATWFQQLCQHPEAEQLFRPLVATLHARSIKVLVEGVETPHHLRIALEGAADLLQGFHLGEPALAGAFFDEGPQAIEALLGTPAKILPFHAMHQRR